MRRVLLLLQVVEELGGVEFQVGFGHFLVTSVGSDAANFHASVERGSGLNPVVFLLRVELGPHFHHLSVSAVKQGWAG